MCSPGWGAGVMVSGYKSRPMKQLNLIEAIFLCPVNPGAVKCSRRTCIQRDICLGALIQSEMPVNEIENA